MSDLKPYSGVRCMCLVAGCSAGAGCPHYTDHCKAHIAHQNAQPAQAGQVLTDDTALIRQLDDALARCRFDSLNMSVADMGALSEARAAASRRLGIAGEKGGSA